MKLLIASDLHGSGYYVKKLVDAFQAEGAEKLRLVVRPIGFTTDAIPAPSHKYG